MKLVWIKLNLFARVEIAKFEEGGPFRIFVRVWAMNDFLNPKGKSVIKIVYTIFRATVISQRLPRYLVYDYQDYIWSDFR